MPDPRILRAAPAKLLDINKQSDRYNYHFRLNPQVIRTGRQANYVDVPLAGHDGSAQADGFQSQWVSNRSQRIEIEFLLNATDPFGDVEEDITALERMMEKTAQTGEPPDLLWVYGGKSTHVRVESLDWTPKIFQGDGRRRQVECRGTLRVMRPAKE